MRVSIVGLGYVGCTLMTCLASDGHTVIGVERDPDKAQTIRAGRLPVIEHDLNTVFLRARDHISIMGDPVQAVLETDVTFVCVGTPPGVNGLNFDQLTAACEQIGRGLWLKDGDHLVVVKSTMTPGVLRQIVKPLLERASGKRAGEAFGLAVNPEFLREGSALSDYYRPPFTVVGIDEPDSENGRRWVNMLKSVFEWVMPPLMVVKPETAEALKLACNAFHALKVTFANEIGNLCRAAGADSTAVMDLFVRDTKLNLSPYYLRPGFAFGGSCLPKDVAALNALADQHDLATPVLRAILSSNVDQIDMIVLAAQKAGAKSVGVIGLAHKPGIDDFRSSPARRLMSRLRQADIQAVGYDPHGRLDTERDLAPVLACDLIVITSKSVTLDQLHGLRRNQIVIDACGLLPAAFPPASVLRLT